jgi:hypothetical protein
MKDAVLIYKNMHGIKYYSDKITDDEKYRFWESKTHPFYKHFLKIKKVITK